MDQQSTQIRWRQKPIDTLDEAELRKALGEAVSRLVAGTPMQPENTFVLGLVTGMAAGMAASVLAVILFALA